MCCLSMINDDAFANKWLFMASMINSSRFFNLAAVGSKLFAIGGDKTNSFCEVYDGGKFAALKTPKFNISYLTASASIGKEIVLFETFEAFRILAYHRATYFCIGNPVAFQKSGFTFVAVFEKHFFIFEKPATFIFFLVHTSTSAIFIFFLVHTFTPVSFTPTFIMLFT